MHCSGGGRKWDWVMVIYVMKQKRMKLWETQFVYAVLGFGQTSGLIIAHIHQVTTSHCSEALHALLC